MRCEMEVEQLKEGALVRQLADAKVQLAQALGLIVDLRGQLWKREERDREEAGREEAAA